MMNLKINEYNDAFDNIFIYWEKLDIHFAI